MNVVVANEKQNELANLDVDIIKSISGSFAVSEIVEMFKNFFYSKMILDVTAMKEYSDVQSYKDLVAGLDADKIIFVLPEGSSLCTPHFLAQLISMGIYNFTTNMNGIKYLLKKPNTLQDVEHIQKMAVTKEVEVTQPGETVISVSEKVSNGLTIIGFKNVTDHAGSTTFIYLLKKELSTVYGKDKVMAIEIDRNDFMFFNDSNMVSTSAAQIRTMISNITDIDILLIDLNNCTDDSFCGDIIYLIEPSTIKLNKLVRRNAEIFKKISKSKVILNKSLLLANDVSDFEGEAGIKVFYNMPPLDERKRNAIVNDFLVKLGLVSRSDSNGGNGSNRIFGLFRR